MPSHSTHFISMYTVSRKKRDRNVFVICTTKLGRCWRNLVDRFRNKFAAPRCKRFLLRLNNGSTLPCETLNAHCTRATIESSEKEVPEFIPAQLWPPNSPDLNQVDNSMWEILQEEVYKTRINSATDEWLSQWWPSLAHSVLSRCFSSSRSVMRVRYTFSCSSPHTL